MLPKPCLSHPVADVEPVGMRQGASLVHQIHGPPGPIGLRSASGRQGRKGAPGVVAADPLADGPFGPEAIGQIVQIDRLVLVRPPEVLDD